jgi:hypothetical protein
MLDFLGIGAQKGGTTWLHRMLAMHPGLEFPAGKEVHFWNSKRSLGTSWYLAQFDPPAAGVRCGEITPAYALLESEVVREIHCLNPELRVVFVLRNPINRAWSSALMALRRAEMRIDEASDQWFVDHFRSKGSLGRGDYAATIERWHSVFSPDQLLLLRFEEIHEQPRQLLHRCATHLGVDPGFFHELPADVLAQRVFPGGGQPLRESLIPELRRLYDMRISRLERLLGWELGHWRAPDGRAGS